MKIPPKYQEVNREVKDYEDEWLDPDNKIAFENNKKIWGESHFKHKETKETFISSLASERRSKYF